MKSETIEKYKTIISLLESGVSQRKLRREYGFGGSAIQRAVCYFGYKTEEKKEIKDFDETVISMFYSGFSTAEIAREIGFTGNGVSGYLKRKGIDPNTRGYGKSRVGNDDYVSMCIETETSGKVKYISGYKSANKSAVFEWVSCGHRFTTPFALAKTKTQCPVCWRESVKRGALQRKLLKVIGKRISCLEKENAIKEKEEQDRLLFETRECVECGSEFECKKTSRNKCCSHDCSKKWANHRKDRRINQSNIVDKDISLPVLFRRDGGFCALCGAACLPYVDSNSDLYPSIDHIIPVTKGGKHSWANVQLAHRGCNTRKSDSV